MGRVKDLPPSSPATSSSSSSLTTTLFRSAVAALFLPTRSEARAAAALCLSTQVAHRDHQRRMHNCSLHRRPNQQPAHLR
ncbi:hypothetical protein C8F01DRAFT_1025902 [Mycena amicta]|nr:hypothetical protein C8F01DRAFT_1025902 [Mycena amicta]